MIKVHLHPFHFYNFLVAIFSAGKDLIKDVMKDYWSIVHITKNLAQYKLLNEHIKMEELLKWGM